MKNLNYCEWINFGEYTIKKSYSWIDIFKDEQKIGVYSDWEYYINGFRRRANFETAVVNNQDNLINFIEKKIEEQKEKIMNLESEKTKLEIKNIELEKKIQDKVVENTMNDLFPNE